MKIISELNDKQVSLKEVLLRKKTSEAITTEQFLGISPQPENTCPIIEDLLTELEGINKTFLEVEKLVDFKPEELEPTECCKNFDLYQNNLKNLQAFKLALNDASRVMPTLEQRIEMVRKACEEERASGTIIKDMIWNRLSHDETSDEVHRPEIAPPKRSLEILFESVEVSLPPFKIEGCECLSHQAQERLETVFNEIDSLMDTVVIPDQIESMYYNYGLIKVWTSELTERLQNASKEFNLTEEIEVYLSRLNFAQKERFETWTSNLKPLKTVSGNNALKTLTSNSEDMIRAKEIGLSIDLYNSFVHKFNFELLTRFDSIGMPELLNEAEEVRAFFYPIKEEETREVRNIIIQVLTHLISKIKLEGRQTYTIV